MVCVLATDSLCIAVETADVSLRLTWCKKLADAYSNIVAFASISIFWNNNSMQYLIDFQSMEMFISGLTPNTEYFLVFDVKPRDGQNYGPPLTQLATRKIRTKYFSKLISMRRFVYFLLTSLCSIFSYFSVTCFLTSISLSEENGLSLVRRLCSCFSA